MKKFFFIILSFFLLIFSVSFVSASYIDKNIVNLPANNRLNLNYNLINSEYVLYPSGSVSSNPWLSKKYSYNYSSTKNWLDAKSCNLILSGTNVNANWNIGTGVLPTYYKDFRDFLAGRTTPQISDINLGNQILNANLWMKANVVYTLVNSSGGLQTVTPPDKVLITDNGMIDFANNIDNGVYTISSPWTRVQIQDLVNVGTLLPGIYYVKVTAIPTDGKCKFGTSTIPVFNNLNAKDKVIKTFPNIFKDADGDGWDDLGTSISFLGTKGKDLCVGEIGIDPNLQGCLYGYSVNGTCDSIISFNGNQLTCTYSDSSWDIGNRDYFYKNNIQISGEGIGSISYIPKDGTGSYECRNADFILSWTYTGWKDKVKGSCQLRDNKIDACSNGLAINTNRFYFKHSQILPSERNDPNSFKNIICDSTKTLKDGINTFNLATSQYRYPQSGVRFLSSDYDDIIRNPDGTLTSNDNKIQGKISCPPDDTNCLIKISGTPININLSKIDNSTTTKTYKIYKEGVLDRTEEIDSKLIALKAHKIKKFKTSDESLNFINKSVALMKKFDIVKNLTYNLGTDTTTVQIKTTNYLDSQIQNLTVYQIIDKSIAASYDDINFISDGGGQRFVVDKDPIIGWYFNDTSGSTTIEYNVSGNNEGGTIIITQEPILFNEGELIINYRENKTGCSAGEIHLFDLDTLESSVIKTKDTGAYQICITHLDSNINLLNGTDGSNILNISSYETNSNISSNFEQLINKLQISVEDNNIYWDLKIQKENPDGNFSCLGSYDLVSSPQSPVSSLFGDCGYRPDNRIWMHLGADYIAPTTSYSIPNLGHSVRVSLNAEDNIGGSGINKTRYCEIGNGNDCQQPELFNVYSNSFMISCTTDWSCTRILKFYSTDLAGNIEDVNTENLYLIDKGSACQSDCTAKPSPNRYLKECRNLNGCTYGKTQGEINNDIGKAVAEKCNFLVENSYVRYNATHEIKCPNGPFKLERFTDISTGIVAPKCRDLVKLPYPVIYDGERIVMNIITCFDK